MSAVGRGLVGFILFAGTTSSLLLGRAQTPRSLGQIPAKHAGFLSLFENDPSNPSVAARFTLLASSFDGVPFSTDYVFAVRRVGAYLNNPSAATVETLTQKVTWPNDISGVPANVMGPNLVAIPDGFLVPFKKKGSLSILNITSSPPQGQYKISSGDDTTEWFYHKVIWKDMDNDGRLDAVTCRATSKAGGKFDGQLLWFKNPGPPYFRSVWTSTVLAEGPDVYLTHALVPAQGQNRDAIFIPAYFSRRLSVYWIESNGTWTNPDQVKSRVIEDNLEVGPFFDVQYVDVNGDGKKDLLATSSNQHNGSVIVYELPEDFRTGTFKKHVIADGFKPAFSVFMQGKTAPGSVGIVWPTVNATGRPSILLSGDDDGNAYILTPISAQADNWQYQKTSFLHAKSGPVGSIVTADVNGDGFTDVFVPEYDKGLIHVYTFKS